MTECENCGMPIKNILRYVEFNGKIYCETCFDELCNQNELRERMDNDEYVQDFLFGRL